MKCHARRVSALTAALIAVALAVAGPAGAQAGQDYISSENVTLLKSIKPAGDGVGARIIGHYLYVTSTKDLEIYDISTPENPQLVGSMNVHVEFENEEVPTNGSVLGISGQTQTVTPKGVCPSVYPASPSGCLVLYDVRDKAAPKQVSMIMDAGDHTSTCVLDCTYFYGSAGSITDARGVLDGVQAKKIGNWQQSPTIPDFNGTGKSGKFVNGCHNLTEIRPGVLMAACQPFLILSVRPEDGGTILQPKLLASGANADGRFIHGNHWPRAGADRLALVGGETNFQPQCADTNGAFTTWDASHANLDGKFSGPLDEYRAKNGSYLDSNPPAQILGCSVHWFDEHPTFHDGGLVALAAYENGTRFLQIGADGKITEQGYFVPLGGSTSAPHWAPGSDVVYAVDYERGLDVLKYTGPHYVPGQPEADRTPGTAGAQPPPASAPAPACKASAGFLRVSADGKGGGIRFTVSRRTDRPFEVAVVQQAAGTKLVRNKTVALFKNRKGSFTWSGAGARDGWYVVRFRMTLQGGGSDVRRISMRRAGGHFGKRPPSHLKDSCGALKSFKLQRPVFGGVGARPLKISYELPRGVDSVKVEASARGRLLRRFKGTGSDAGQVYQLVLPASGIKRGTDVQVRITVVRAGSRQSSVLVSRRI
ncbi:MAG: hypothetical protein QOI19_1149 [Thermoleophilaceae bacterium]|nr:hypothetical protein [Thermoleophilaceae bacterium]